MSAASSVALASLAVGVLGAGMSAYGMEQQSEAQANQAKYQSQVMANNQKVANESAQLTAQQGEINAANVAQQQRARMGALVASQAASGVDVGTGSNANVQESQDILGEKDTAATRYNAAIQSQAIQNQAIGMGAQSQLDASSGKAYADSAIGGAVGHGFGSLGGLGLGAAQYFNNQPPTPQGGGMSGWNNDTPLPEGSWDFG